METISFNLICFVAAFLSMEGLAWFTHKYIMHGLLWTLHRDHHQKEGYSFWERNDLFFLVFALPGILCIYYGISTFSPIFWIGLGITSYGFTYFLVHDVFIHQRIKWIRQINHPYFRAIRKAHKVHHKHLVRENGECFGMLWVPLKYFREARQVKT